MSYRARTCRPVRRRRQAGQLGQACSCRTPELDGAEIDQLLRLLQWLCMAAVIFSLTAAVVEFFL